VNYDEKIRCYYSFSSSLFLSLYSNCRNRDLEYVFPFAFKFMVTTENQKCVYVFVYICMYFSERILTNMPQYVCMCVCMYISAVVAAHMIFKISIFWILKKLIRQKIENLFKN